MTPDLKPAKTQGWISIAGNIGLFAIKLWAGIKLGSAAFVADAWHTLSDSLSSVILLTGVKVAEKPPDQRHPFGHGRAERIAALLIGVLLLVVAFEFLLKGIDKLRHPQTTAYGWFGISVLLVSIAVKEAMAQYAFWIARRTGLESVRADAWHHRSDAISSVILLAGILVGGKWIYLDGVLTLLVTLIIGYAALQVMWATIDQILGRDIDSGLRQTLLTICRTACDGRELDAHHFHIHDYGGGRQELTFHIRMPGDTPLAAAHQCAQRIEKAIFDQTGITATIHIEPVKHDPPNSTRA